MAGSAIAARGFADSPIRGANPPESLDLIYGTPFAHASTGGETMRTTILLLMLSMLSMLGGGCTSDGGPGLVLDRAWWRNPGVLRVALWTSAGGWFELEEANGEHREGAADCLNERCLLTFEGAIEPVNLWHFDGARSEVTPLLECSEDAFGLCPFGFTCVDRTCEPLCSPGHPAGACIEDGATCEDGWCSIPDC